ncbi:hypothetical protein OAB01_00565 [Bacteroidia bacterium]|nr:hypothetical protein [Bacteroidia bacterium]
MTRLILTLSLVITFLLSSCYYDTEEELYPTNNGNNCDSVKGAFSAEILPVINVQCRSCHNTSFSSGGVNLEGFTNIQNAALNGKLIQSLNHESGVSPMPQNSPKLDDCTLKAFEDWKNAGAPNN